MSSPLRDKYLLLRIYTKSDPEAFAELYDQYVASIYRFIYFKVSTREDAEDLTGETFLRAWHYLSEHKDIASFTGLIYRIARNLVIDHYRYRKPSVSLDEKQEQGEEVNAHDFGQAVKKIDTSVDAQRLISAMQQLKDEYREVLQLRYIDELSHGEIAKILEKNLVAVRVLLHRASKTLKQLLEKHE